MLKILGRPAVILVAAVATVVYGSPTFACDCAPAPVARALRDADLVFSGIVTSVRLAQKALSEGEALTIVELTPGKWWKGAPLQAVTLHTHRNLFTCEGYEFVVGESYVVFARRNTVGTAERYGLRPSTVTYGVTLCGGTTPQRTGPGGRLEEELDRLAVR